ncbi:response regulator transcription factor [Dactylosporangium sp. NPDC000244]|uniref:response regulator transcription factor n=1 Tax=Dactylosporangium sp. NPDC000244 TaxID=3154365 RepID=UPI00332368A0
MEKLISEDGSLAVLASVASVDALDRTFDIVILDLPLRARTVIVDVIATVARIGHPLICSTWEQPPALTAAVRAGARGCITRRTEQQAVRDALRVVSQGGFYVCPRLVEQFRAELARPADEDPNGLAPREIETLRWIALGYTHAQVATRMGLSPATVNTYAKRIRAKLKVSNKAELTRLAIELGHLPPRHETHPAG